MRYSNERRAANPRTLSSPSVHRVFYYIRNRNDDRRVTIIVYYRFRFFRITRIHTHDARTQTRPLVSRTTRTTILIIFVKNTFSCARYDRLLKKRKKIKRNKESKRSYGSDDKQRTPI